VSRFEPGIKIGDVLLLKAAGTFRKVWSKANFAHVTIQYTYCQLCMYVQDSPVEIQTPNIPEPDRPQHARPATFVIAQQYASVVLTFRSGVVQPSGQCCRLLGKNKDALKHFATEEIMNCEV